VTPTLLGFYAPGSDEWLEARRTRVGGSEIAAILGLSPYESAFSLWHRKRGEVAPVELNPRMEVGNYVEDAIAKWFADQHPEFTVVRTGTWVHPDRPWQLANPDRILEDASTGRWVGILECKFSQYGDGFGRQHTDEIPVHYMCQTRHYSDVFDGLPVFVAGLVGGQFGEWYVEWNEADAHLMRQAGKDFLDAIANDERPDIDDSYATLQTVRELHPDIVDGNVEVDAETRDAYVTALAAYKEAKAAKDRATSLVLDQLGSVRNAVHDGQRFAYRSARANADGTPGQPFLATDWRSLSRQEQAQRRQEIPA
jgi:putative phage-type endonuclease